MPSPKVAVVTGAGSGIGRALALACAREGMAVVAADIETEALAQTQALVKAAGADCMAQRCDVSSAADVEQLAEASWRWRGGVDWLFNNAGVAVLGTAWDATEDDWRWVLGVNLMGVAHGVRSFVPRMRARGTPAHIVNTASAAGLATVGGSAVYCASKHAVVAYSECLAKDLEQVGSSIGVSVLCPSLVATRINESQRNRPAALAAAGPTAAAYEERVRAGMASSAVSAEDVARAAVEAIHARRFYVIPHARTGASVQDRSQKIMGDFHDIHQENLQ
ncbi:SDR family NAD(P)-dependent oxidoreductase [Acidovorax sp. ST3]|uniref:SDR family NAD(P)-dependent oxidoreductase n=1 Tax=Acidovorax sp. ST3 TaxID=2219062 RepID=UPI000DA658C0|nr:SDR family NAD(P)-dependent oxidoreductase [Acidovorax sp. ST3]